MPSTMARLSLECSAGSVFARVQVMTRNTYDTYYTHDTDTSQHLSMPSAGAAPLAFLGFEHSSELNTPVPDVNQPPFLMPLAHF